MRAYARNGAGTAYGETVSFNTTSHFSGSGTEDDPYQIASLDDLRALSENPCYWGCHFEQTGNIDLSGSSTWDPDGSGGYYGFSPIGNNSTAFTGSYNGGNYTIQKLYINRNSTSYVGLFGHTDGATVENLRVIGVNITGGSCVGGLVGYKQRAVDDSFWDTETSGQDESAGGTGKTTDEMTTKSTFIDTSTEGLDSAWDFDDIWRMTYRETCPCFQWQDGACPLPPTDVSLGAVGGTPMPMDKFQLMLPWILLSLLLALATGGGVTVARRVNR